MIKQLWGVVAAAAVVIAGCSSGANATGHTAPAGGPAPATASTTAAGPVSGEVDCSPSSDASANLSGLRADVTAIKSRLTVMGVHGAAVSVDSTAGRISIETTDRPAAAVEVACQDGTFIAPVLDKVPGRPTSAGDPFTPATIDSQTLLSGLPFPIPSTLPELDALTPRERRQLDALLHSISCAYPIIPVDGSLISCDDSGTLYLLGAPVVGSDGIVSATPEAPSATNPQWAVLIKLTTLGGLNMAKYTSAHNTGGAPSAAVDDELVVIGSGRALSLGAVQEPITGGTIQFSGNLSQSQAQRVAAEIVPTPLPLPLHVAQVQQLTAPPSPTPTAAATR